MFDFFLDKALILADQSGFKPGDSCINQLLSIPHNIYKSFDDGYEGVKPKHELVQIHELRFQIHELRVRIHELRVLIHELRVQIHELRVQINELED